MRYYLKKMFKTIAHIIGIVVQVFGRKVKHFIMRKFKHFVQFSMSELQGQEKLAPLKYSKQKKNVQIYGSYIW